MVVVVVVSCLPARFPAVERHRWTIWRNRWFTWRPCKRYGRRIWCGAVVASALPPLVDDPAIWTLPQAVALESESQQRALARRETEVGEKVRRLKHEIERRNRTIASMQVSFV